jgi:hypothetical protein
MSHLVARFGNGLGDADKLPLAAVVLLDQLGQFGHEQGHLLSGCDDVVIVAGPLANLLVQVMRRHHDGPLAGRGRVLKHVLRLVVRRCVQQPLVAAGRWWSRRWRRVSITPAVGA